MMDSATQPSHEEPPSTETTASTAKSLLDRLVQAIGGEPKDQQELLAILRDAATRQLIDQDSLSMIEGVFRVDDMRVRDIMIPRAQMVYLNQSDDFDTVLEKIIDSGHSRFPVIGENRDNIVGVLLAKDLLPYFGRKDKAGFTLGTLLRPAVITPDSKRLNLLLSEFRSHRNHMAMVVDEYGGVSGLVTIEDVLEIIVGKIDDEHDRDEEGVVRDLGDGRYALKALMPIEDFNQHFATTYPSDDYDTIGGLIIHEFGQVPAPGDAVTLGPYVFRVLSSDSRRLTLLQATPVGKDEF